MKACVIDKEKTGQNLKNLIQARGLSMTDVQNAVSLGCVQTVYQWVNGHSIPKIDQLVPLKGLLGVPLDDLLIYNFQ